MGKLLFSFAVVALVWDLMSTQPGDSILFRTAGAFIERIQNEVDAFAAGGSPIERLQSFFSKGVSNYEDQKSAGRLGPTAASTDIATVAGTIATNMWREFKSWFVGDGIGNALAAECRDALATAALQPIQLPANRSAERNRYRMLEEETSAYFQNASRDVRDAISCAAVLTAVDRQFLIETAFRESGFNAKAKARKSSAAGLYQFVDQTWFAMIHQRGSLYGLTDYALTIERLSPGNYKVINHWQKRKLLNLRYNPKVNAIMAAELAIANRNYLVRKLGRTPSRGELYAAHFLGVGSAEKLITLNISAPQNQAATHFPKAAKVNKRIFYDKNGAITISQLHTLLIDPHGPVEEPALPPAVEESTEPIG